MTQIDAKWDVVVVGAGPAGSICAYELARCGLSVLLVDKATFPRYKICGCCLNGAGVAVLKKVGLGQVLNELPTAPIERLLLASAGKQASLKLNIGGLAVSREALDHALLQAARSAGATILEGTIARLALWPVSDRATTATEGLPPHNGDLRSAETAGSGDPRRTVIELSAADATVQISAKFVIAADGLRGSLLEHHSEFPRSTAAQSRIGVGATLEKRGQNAFLPQKGVLTPFFYCPGTIYMAVGADGYVGQVCLDDGRLNLAAALDRRFVAAAGTPAEAARQIVTEAGMPWSEDWSASDWHGTPALTRRLHRVAVGGVFVIGDAGGYIEPFTGEGMAWAMESGAALAAIIAGGRTRTASELVAAWNAKHRQLLGRRMLVCKTISAALRWPRFTRIALSALSKAPWLAVPAIRYVGSR